MNATAQLLERLGALVQQALREDAARHGLLPVHVQVLAYLGQANAYSDMPIAVAEYLGITRGTVSQSVAVLERKGFIDKEPDSRHRRRVHLRLTAAGEAVLRGGWAQRLEQALAAVPNGEALEPVLRSLLVGLQRQNRRRAFGVCHGCAHFLRKDAGARCGLTGEPLATEQTRRICREWTAPEGAPAGATDPTVA